MQEAKAFNQENYSVRWCIALKKLLQEYKKSLKEVNRELNGGWKERNLTDVEGYCRTFRAMKSDLEFVIKWLEKGYQPDAHYRGIERNDAYYVMRPHDPAILERYMENKQANAPFEFVEESYGSVEEMQERKRVEFEDSLSPEKMAAIRKAKKELDDFEMQVVLLSEQGRTVREIGAMLGVNHMKVQRTKNKCRAKFEAILTSIEQKQNKLLFICHCTVRAHDGHSHISAKPTVSVEAIDMANARIEAKLQLEARYIKLGCSWVDVEIPLIKQV